MKKNIVLFLLLLLMLNSCERDDICIDPITPHLIIRFYNNDDPTAFKSVNQLSVKATGIENDSILFTGLTDSIAIPLKVTEVNTQYTLTIDSDDGAGLNRDIFTVNYTAENVFVGRSCGFKSIFNDSSYQLTTDSDNWIQGFEIITQQIENETAAHVKIFH